MQAASSKRPRPAERSVWRRETQLPDEVRLDFLSPSDQPGCLGTLGPYQIVDVIGRGGMGIVLRALDTKLNRIVAVKVLAPELAANPNARHRFLREAQAAAAVSHPHVVTIHAVDEDKLPYLVMECVVGQSLQEKLDRAGALRLTEILRIGRQIAEGLAAAHQQGLMHRDIKPANILLENGVERVKITDFGLARAVDDVAITRTGEVFGTPQYMSPEQARGEPVDSRSDLFSLGCVLYAMCTGRSPFRGDSLPAVIKRVTEDTPRPIAEVNPEIPAWLIEVVQRLLEKQPDQRFQTAAEVAEVLAGHLAGVQHPLAGGRRPSPEPPARGGSVPAASAAPARSWSLRILVWLAIVLIAMVLIVPCLVGVGLLVPMLARQKAVTKAQREAEEALRRQIVAVEAEAVRSQKAADDAAQRPSDSQQPPTDGLPPGVRWETHPPFVEYSDGYLLNVRLLSEGMLVALRKRSLFDGQLATEEKVATAIGTTELHVQKGDYDVLVRDEWFGWRTGNRATIVVRKTPRAH